VAGRFGNEWRIGSTGVPLTLAPDLHRRVIINKEPPLPVYYQLGLNREVGARITGLLRTHGLPSRDRLIVLSANYPGRDELDIARAFGMQVKDVRSVLERVVELRESEPLSTELWEDITEEEVWPDELRSRASEVRRRNELVKRAVLGSAGIRASRRAFLGRREERRGAVGGARKEGRPAQPQPKDRPLPKP
jgi:hypothetical protein